MNETERQQMKNKETQREIDEIGNDIRVEKDKIKLNAQLKQIKKERKILDGLNILDEEGVLQDTGTIGTITIEKTAYERKKRIERLLVENYRLRVENDRLKLMEHVGSSTAGRYLEEIDSLRKKTRGLVEIINRQYIKEV